MKKILAIIFVTLITLLSTSTVFSLTVDDTDVENINVNIEYVEDEDFYFIEISESNIFNEEPKMEVNTNFVKGYVYFIENDKREFVNSVTNEGIVSFIVKQGGTYAITSNPFDSSPSPSKHSGYEIPKTGV